MRILLGITGVVGVLMVSPWVPVVCMVVLAFRYRAWEVVVLGLLIDFAWQPAGTILHAFPYFTVFAILVVWAFEPIRAQFLR